MVIPKGNVNLAVFEETLLVFSIFSKANGKDAAEDAVENAISTTGNIAL